MGLDEEDARRSVIRALADDVKKHGCRGFDDAVNVVIDSLNLPIFSLERESTLQRFEAIRRQADGGISETVVEVCRRLVVSSEALHRAMEDETAREMIAVRVLAELAGAMICPASLLTELVEHDGASFQTIWARRTRVVDHLADASEMLNVARQLLADPSGQSVRKPRMPRVKLSQAQILASPMAY